MIETIATKVIYREDPNCVIIVTDDSVILKEAQWPIMAVPVETFKYVSNYVAQNAEKLRFLLTEGDRPGTKFYWEENHHDRIVNEIFNNKHFNKHHIANSLYAFEM